MPRRGVFFQQPLWYVIFEELKGLAWVMNGTKGSISWSSHIIAKFQKLHAGAHSLWRRNVHRRASDCCWSNNPRPMCIQPVEVWTESLRVQMYTYRTCYLKLAFLLDPDSVEETSSQLKPSNNQVQGNHNFSAQRVWYVSLKLTKKRMPQVSAAPPPPPRRPLVHPCFGAISLASLPFVKLLHIVSNPQWYSKDLL